MPNYFPARTPWDELEEQIPIPHLENDMKKRLSFGRRRSRTPTALSLSTRSDSCGSWTSKYTSSSSSGGRTASSTQTNPPEDIMSHVNIKGKSQMSPVQEEPVQTPETGNRAYALSYQVLASYPSDEFSPNSPDEEPSPRGVTSPADMEVPCMLELSGPQNPRTGPPLDNAEHNLFLGVSKRSPQDQKELPSHLANYLDTPPKSAPTLFQNYEQDQVSFRNELRNSGLFNLLFQDVSNELVGPFQNIPAEFCSPMKSGQRMPAKVDFRPSSPAQGPPRNQDHMRSPVCSPASPLRNEAHLGDMKATTSLRNRPRTPVYRSRLNAELPRLPQSEPQISENSSTPMTSPMGNARHSPGRARISDKSAVAKLKRREGVACPDKYQYCGNESVWEHSAPTSAASSIESARSPHLWEQWSPYQNSPPPIPQRSPYRHSPNLQRSGSSSKAMRKCPTSPFCGVQRNEIKGLSQAKGGILRVYVEHAKRPIRVRIFDNNGRDLLSYRKALLEERDKDDHEKQEEREDEINGIEKEEKLKYWF